MCVGLFGVDFCVYRLYANMYYVKFMSMNILCGIVGVCEKYKAEGEYCSWLDTANGHCGCQPGLQCRFVEDPSASSFEPFLLSKRGGVPGSIQCAQPLTTTATPWK